MHRYVRGFGGGDTEIYIRFDDVEHGEECKDNPVECDCGKFIEIANSVFIEYQKTEKGFIGTTSNVDFGGGIERLLQAVDNKSDMFQTSLFNFSNSGHRKSYFEEIRGK